MTVSAGTRYGDARAGAARRRLGAGQPGVAAAHLGGGRRRHRDARLGRPVAEPGRRRRGLTFVGPDGALRSVRRGDDDFAGSVVALGALGIVVRRDARHRAHLRRRAGGPRGPAVGRRPWRTWTTSRPAQARSACSPTGAARASSRSGARRGCRPRSRHATELFGASPVDRPAPSRCPASTPSTRPRSWACPDRGTSACRTSGSTSRRATAPSCRRSTWCRGPRAVDALEAVRALLRPGRTAAAGQRGPHDRRRRPLALDRARRRPRRPALHVAPARERGQPRCCRRSRPRWHRSTPARTGASSSPTRTARSPVSTRAGRTSGRWCHAPTRTASSATRSSTVTSSELGAQTSRSRVERGEPCAGSRPPARDPGLQVRVPDPTDRRQRHDVARVQPRVATRTAARASARRTRHRRRRRPAGRRSRRRARRAPRPACPSRAACRPTRPTGAARRAGGGRAR